MMSGRYIQWKHGKEGDAVVGVCVCRVGFRGGRECGVMCVCVCVCARSFGGEYVFEDCICI